MKTKTRISAILLSFLAALLFLCTSCGKEEEEKKPKVISNPEVTVYAENRFDFPAEYMLDTSRGGIRCYDGRIYADTFRLLPGDENNDAECVTVSWNTDGADFREETGETGTAPCKEGAHVMSAEVLSNGETATFEVLSDISGMSGWFCVRDEAGNVLFSVDLPACFGKSYGDEGSAAAGVGFQLWDADAVGSGAERRYLAAASAGIVCFDRDGKVCQQLGSCNVKAVTVFDEKVYFFQQGSSGNNPTAYGGGISLYSFDLTTGERGAEILLPSEISSATGTVGTLHRGYADGFPAYWQNGQGLFGLSFSADEAGKDVCSAVLVVDWNESDIIGGYEDIYVLDEETVLAFDMEFDSTMPQAFASWLSVLHRLPKEAVKNRIRLEVVSLSPFDMEKLRGNAVKFNRTHPGVHITVTDWLSKYDGDYDTARLHLDAEIAAGHIPDILFLSQHASNINTAKEYVHADVFCDLAALAKDSAVFDYDDLVGSMKTPFTDEEGRQFLFPAILNSQVLVSNGALDGPKTAEEMMAYYETLPEDVSLLTNDPASLSLFFRYGAVDDLTDERAGTCCFDDGRFASYETFCREKNENGMKTDSMPKYYEQQALVREGKLILFVPHNLTNLLEYARLESVFGGTVIPVGYPNERRLVYGECYYDSYIGITEACEHKAEALEYLWEFFKPFENTRVGMFGDLEHVSSMTRTGIYAQADVLADYTLVIEGNNDRCRAVPDAEASDYPGAKVKVTRETADRYIAYLDAIEKNAYSAGPLWDIIKDETFSDVPTTPEKLAENIQARASLYLAEQKK